MKKFVVVFGAMILSSSAFAQTYSCDVLKNKAGEAILGGPAYSLELDGQGVYLLVTTGADEGQPLKTTEYRMEKEVQEVEGAVYEAQGVTATIFAEPNPRDESVSISTVVGGEENSASCFLKTTVINPEIGSDLATPIALGTQWHDGVTSLTITGESARIQFACGAIEIAKGWNTDGAPMDGLRTGGPVVLPGSGTPVTVTATMKDGKVTVLTGDSAADVYVFERGASKPTGLVCL